MASTHFTYSPTGVTTNPGDATVRVTANTINSGQTDRTATITFSNSVGNTKSVTVTQRYRPWFLQDAQRTIPAIGGNIYFTAHTEYDIRFDSIPTWCTLWQGNTQITAGTKINAADADGRLFRINASANTSTSSRSVTNTFCMRHYIGTSLQTYKDYLEVHQDGRVENHIVITSSTISCEGGTIRGYVEENEDFPWFAKDNLYAYTGTPWTTPAVTSLISEDVMRPTNGAGSATTTFTVTIPRNPTTSALTWVVAIEAGYEERTLSASTTQAACPPPAPEPPDSNTAFTLSSDHVPATGGSITATVYTGEYLAYGFGDHLTGYYYDDDTSAGSYLMEDVLTPWEDPAPTGNFYYNTPWTITVPANNTGRDIVWWFYVRGVDESPSKRCYFIQYGS